MKKLLTIILGTLFFTTTIANVNPPRTASPLNIKLKNNSLVLAFGGADAHARLDCYGDGLKSIVSIDLLLDKAGAVKSVMLPQSSTFRYQHPNCVIRVIESSNKKVTEETDFSYPRAGDRKTVAAIIAAHKREVITTKKNSYTVTVKANENENSLSFELNI